MITVDGRRTPRYAAARQINTTWLHQVGRELKPLDSESVVHANETPLPNGTVGFTPTPLLTEVSGSPVVIGTFHSRDTTSTDRWLLVANRSHHDRARATVTPNQQTVASVATFQPPTQTYEPRPLAPIPFDLAPGAATLVKLTTK